MKSFTAASLNLVAGALLLLLLGVAPVWAAEQVYSETRFRFKDSAELVVVAPRGYERAAVLLARSIEKLHSALESSLGSLPPFSTQLRMLEEEEFYTSTGAPRWTNALYFRNQIIIPINNKSVEQSDALLRSVRHEYTHAAIHALSGGRCPGWLDEGLAQWWEGAENPALRPALARWMQQNNHVPFYLLQGGFTRLDEGMVAAAYGQSLIASTSLTRTYGYQALRSYLDYLRRGDSKPNAFHKAFGLHEDAFEIRIGSSLKRWAESTRLHTASATSVRTVSSRQPVTLGGLQRARAEAEVRAVPRPSE